MKTVIIYATKYGCAKKSAELLAKNINGSIDIFNIKDKKSINLDDYDQVIIGGSIYMGQVQKQIKQYCIEYEQELITKRIGLYICCMQQDNNAEVELNDAFPNKLLEHATVKEYFGGEITYKKLSFLHKVITKMVAKSSDEFPPLDENKNSTNLSIDKIKQFAKEMNEQS